MKKKLLLLFSVAFLSMPECISQTSEKTTQPVSIVFTENSNLYSLMQKIETKELEISNAISSSRGENAKLRDELSSLKSEYTEQLILMYERVSSVEEKEAIKVELNRISIQH